MRKGKSGTVEISHATVDSDKRETESPARPAAPHPPPEGRREREREWEARERIAWTEPPRGAANLVYERRLLFFFVCVRVLSGERLIRVTPQAKVAWDRVETDATRRARREIRASTTTKTTTTTTMEQQTKWTEEEIHTLSVALKKFPADRYSPLGRYLKVSSLLPNKGVRDVALRVKWLSKREEKKNKKGSNSSSKRKADKANKSDSSAYHGQQSALGEKANVLYAPITGVLDENIVVIKQIQQNMMHNKVRENTDLLLKFRDNLMKAQGAMGSIGGVMKSMPPLPAQVNTQLVRSVLPSKNS